MKVSNPRIQAYVGALLGKPTWTEDHLDKLDEQAVRKVVNAAEYVAMAGKRRLSEYQRRCLMCKHHVNEDANFCEQCGNYLE